MTVLLLMVVFTGLCLAMLQASAVHLKINGARRFSALLDVASENGLKRAFGDLAAWLETEALLAPVGEERVEAVRAAPAAAFPALIEAALGPALPRTLMETAAGMTWTSRTDWSFGGVEDMGTFLRITAAFRIESQGGLDRIRSRRNSVLEGEVGFLAGRLPLAAVPLYIKGDPSAGEGPAWPAENGVRLGRKPGQALGPGLAAAETGVLPEDAAAALAAKALNIGVFRPGDLSPAELRRALGLEASNEIVPDGVYLIHNDLGLGGVFVQGDLDEVVLALRGDTQIVVLRAGGLEWRLEWSPARGRTEFVTPEGAAAYDLVPLPILFVNGAIGALGGGTAGLDGRIEIAGGETPCVLGGVDLTIVSTERVTIASHLILEGVRWQDGIPYSKDSEAQLVIYAAGQDVLSGETAPGGIAIAGGAPDDLKVQASLTAAGGFEIEGGIKSVELLGALHASGYAGNGSWLTLYRDDRAAAGKLPANGPLTAEPHLAVFALRALAWKEY